MNSPTTPLPAPSHASATPFRSEDVNGRLPPKIDASNYVDPRPPARLYWCEPTVSGALVIWPK